MMPVIAPVNLNLRFCQTCDVAWKVTEGTSCWVCGNEPREFLLLPYGGHGTGQTVVFDLPPVDEPYLDRQPG